MTGHRQVTDAHLLTVARRSGAVIATFDGGLAELGGSDVELLRA
jgi:predicted nucleic acid-binding protein